jgi:hypothetical protein
VLLVRDLLNEVGHGRSLFQRRHFYTPFSVWGLSCHYNLHRNLLLDESGHLKVADFGLSKLLTTDAMHEQYQMTGETGTCEATHRFP